MLLWCSRLPEALVLVGQYLVILPGAALFAKEILAFTAMTISQWKYCVLFCCISVLLYENLLLQLRSTDFGDSCPG